MEARLDEKEWHSMKNQEEITQELRMQIARKYKGRQSNAAEAWGVTPSFVSMVMAQHKKPSQSMLDDIGYMRVEYPARYVKAK
jgi:hypothetical protein